MSESQLSVRCFKCGCFGHRGIQCENSPAKRGSLNSGAIGMLDKCWICGCLGHIAVECKEQKVTCFSCGKRGHKQEDCNSPMANCWNCGEKGHIKKKCPLKTDIGMCFYCHTVGHHSKECDKKVCYYCSSKDHLFTGCPFKDQRFQPRSTRYLRRMRKFPRGYDNSKGFQPRQFPNQLLFENQYFELDQQQQTPRCIRSKSDILPFSSVQERTPSISQTRMPKAVRSNSYPAEYLAAPLEHFRMGHSLDDFDLGRNHSPLRSQLLQFGFQGQITPDGSEFGMVDFNYSDESLMKVMESEKDSNPVVPPLDGRRKSVTETDGPVRKESVREYFSGEPIYENSSDVRRSPENRLRQEIVNPDKDSVESAINVDAEEEQQPVQDQQTVWPSKETKTEIPDGEVVAVGTEDKSASNVINTGKQSTHISLSTKANLSSNTTELTMYSEIKKHVKTQNIEGLMCGLAKIKLKPAETSSSESQSDTQKCDVEEELKRTQKRLAETTAKLVQKKEELDITQKQVQKLKDYIILENKKSDCQKQNENSTKGENVRNRCATCIQIFKNLESCEMCVI